MTKCSRCIATLGLILTVVTFCQSISELTRSELETRGSVEPSDSQQLLLNKWRDNENASTKPPLTGIPQVDYVHDPNLPRELQGYDLSDYPFYNRVPNVQFNFSCDDRHDGFYASIPHKCQVYHNCLFGVRYDFLCANYTAFDQSNFICSWANIVDCENSERYYSRNEDLYVEATTTTTTTAAPVVQIVYVDRETGNVRNKPGGGNRGGPRKKTTTARTTEYYYDDYEQGAEPAKGASQPNSKKQNTEYAYDDTLYYDDVTEKSTTTTKKPLPIRRPNRPQKTRTGNNNNDRSSSRLEQRTNPQSPSASPQIPDYDVEGEQPLRAKQEGGGQRGQPIRRRRKKTTTSTTTTVAPEYYDEYYDYYENEGSPSPTPPPKKKQKPIPGARPTAADRRNALLTSRVSHLVPKAIPPTNSEPDLEVETVVEEPPQTSSRQKTGSSSTAVAASAPSNKADLPKSSSFDYYEYDDAPVAVKEVVVTEQPVVEPVVGNSRRRGQNQGRLTRSQIDRARTRRHLIDM